MLQKGQIVQIFEDPMSETRLEGKAQLLEKTRTATFLEYWMVEFLDDGFRAVRKINPKGKNK